MAFILFFHCFLLLHFSPFALFFFFHFYSIFQLPSLLQCEVLALAVEEEPRFYPFARGANLIPKYSLGGHVLLISPLVYFVDVVFSIAIFGRVATIHLNFNSNLGMNFTHFSPKIIIIRILLTHSHIAAWNPRWRPNG